jgi:hypothetical protein
MPQAPQADTPAVPSVAITAQFMQSFELESPIAPGATFVIGTSQSSPDQCELYFLGSAGSLFRVYPDPASDTGWSCDQVPVIKGSPVTGLAYGWTGPPSAQVPQTAFNLYGNIGGVVGWMVVTDSALTAWGPICGNMNGLTSIRPLAGNCIAQTQNTTETWYLDHNAPKNPVQLTAAGPGITVNDFCAAVLPVQFPGQTQPVAAVQSIVSYNALDSSVDIIQGAYAPSVPSGPVSPVPAPYGFTTSAAIAGFSTALIGQESRVAGLTTGGGIVMFDYDAAQFAFVPNAIFKDRTFTGIALCGGADALELFAIGTDHALYHARQVGPWWSELVCVDDSQLYVDVQAFTLASGQTQAFAVTQTGGLFQIAASPQSGDWSIVQIQVETPPPSGAAAALGATSIYSSSLLVTNPDGTPYALQPAQVTADEAVTIQVNGQFVYVDPTTPFSAATDLQGRLQVWQVVASLGSPTISVTLPFLAPGSAIVMDPSATLQTTLAQVTAEQLLTPDNIVTDNYGTTGSLIPAGTSPSDVSEAAKAIVSAAEMVLPWTELSPAEPSTFTFARRTDRRVAHYLEGLDPANFALPAPRLRTGARWSIERTEQGLVFASGDAVAGIASPTAFLGLNFSWGDFVDLVTEGLWEVGKIIVEGSKAVFHFVVNGVKKVIHAALESVTQIFDMIGMVFEWIGAKFKQLFEWLAFIFNWNDIIAVSNLLQTAMSGALEFIPLALKALEAQVADFSSSVETQLKSTFSAAITSLTGADTTLASSYAQSAGDTSPDGDTALHADDHSIARVGFSNNVGGATSTATPQAGTQNMQNLGTGLSGLYTNLQATSGYTQWSDLPSTWQSPSDVAAMSLAGILTAGEAVGLATLSGLSGMAGLLLEGAADAIAMVTASYLTANWDIPLISGLYQEITGSSLTTLGLISLLIAMPTTMTIKLTSPNMIPTQAVLDGFAAWCTPSNLMDASGLNGASGLANAKQRMLDITGDAPAWQPAAAYALGFVSAFSAFGMAVIEPFVDLWLNPNINLTQSGAQLVKSFGNKIADVNWLKEASPSFWLSTATLGLEIVSWVCSDPVLTSPLDDLSWSFSNFQACQVFLWFTALLPIILDLLSMAEFSESARIANDWMPFLYSACGVIQLVMLVWMNAFGDDAEWSARDFIASYIGCIPLIDKWLHADFIIEGTGGVSYVILPMLDRIANAYLGVFTIMANVQQSDQAELTPG